MKKNGGESGNFHCTGEKNTIFENRGRNKNTIFWANIHPGFRFAKLKQLKTISEYLPCGDFKLEPAIYEMVLFDFLKTDVEGFLLLIRRWSSDLYNSVAVVNAVLEQLREDVKKNIFLVAATKIPQPFLHTSKRRGCDFSQFKHILVYQK